MINFIFNQKDVYVLHFMAQLPNYKCCIFSQLHALVQFYVLAAMLLKRKQPQIVATSYMVFVGVRS